MNTTADKAPVAIIADHEELGRQLLAEAASDTGLLPLVHDNGASALQSALANDVSIVLLNVQMPDMDGYSVCERLRAEPRFAMVPIVMLTGDEDSASITRAFGAGATDFIAKPVNWKLLPQRLEYILRTAAQIRTLAQRESQARTLLEALPDRLWVVTPDGEIRWCPQVVGSAPGTISTTDTHPLPPATDLPQQLERALGAIRDTAADGLPRMLEYRDSGKPERSYELRFGRHEGGDVVVVRRDTSERTAAAERIERLAYFDALTGLPNRQRCLETAELFLSESAASQEHVAFIYLDLNGFKRINDTFGHLVGDAVLRTVANKLAETIAAFHSRYQHIALARFGGDEFVIVLRHPDARSFALEVATACCSALKDPIAYDGLEFHSSPSIGVAVYPDDGLDVATVLKHADTAMYHAKNAAVSAVAVYSSALSNRLRDFLDLEARLRRAVRDNGLHLQYQPKFSLGDGQIAGVEALVRWCDPEHGDISPNRFVAIAEESGLIIDIGGWVVRAACRQARAWLNLGVSIPIAINISAKDLLHGDPARLVEFEAKAAGIPASLIQIEITESLLVKESGAVRKAFDRFRSLGCQIALDDFGTGHACLAYITRFPPDRIKIDQAFVRHVDQSPADAAIASAILSLGESLNLVVTAEGVERSGQLEWLRRRNCQEAQGFLLSRPLWARDFEQQFLRIQTSDSASGKFCSLTS